MSIEMSIEMIVVGIAFVVLYLFLASAVNEQMNRSRGGASLFWLLVWIGTFSFLFSGNSSASNTDTTQGENEDSCSYWDNWWWIDDCNNSSNSDDYGSVSNDWDD